MNRRQFLKRAAAACAGISAAGLAAVVGPSVTEPVPFKPNPAQQAFFDQPYIEWKNYACAYAPTTRFATIYDEFGEWHDFKPFPTEADRLKYRAKAGL